MCRHIREDSRSCKVPSQISKTTTAPQTITNHTKIPITTPPIITDQIQPNPPQYQNQSKPPKSLDELMGDLINSQQHLQNNVQSNNNVVHRMQDAQKEQKASLEMLARQMSQLARSLNEMRGNEGKIPASVRMPDKANVSQITLRSGKEYRGPTMKVVEEGELSERSGSSVQLPRWKGRADGKNIDSIEELRRPFPHDSEPVLEEAEPVFQEAESQPKGSADVKSKEQPKESPHEVVKGTKPFLYRFAKGRKKEDPIDFMSIFGKLEINLPFLQAMKLPPLSKFIKEFIAGKAKGEGKIVIGENVSAVI